MKYSAATLIAAGAGVASAFPNAAGPVAARDSWADQHPWKAPGKGDVRAPCPGLNTLANHGFLPHNGKGISIDMAVKAFKDGFNMGSDIIQSAGGSALSVCQQVTGKACKAFDLDQLNTPHTFEHDGSYSRQDFNFGKGDNHNFNQDVYNTVLDVWKDTNVISYSYANAARLMRLANCKKDDTAGWFLESDATQLTETAFFMGTMGTPQDGNARKDWITYWWTHERFPFELGWLPTQRAEHNQSTINTMINNIVNAPAPPTHSSSSSSSASHSSTSTGASTGTGKPTTPAATSTPAVTLPSGYGIQTDASTVKIVPTTSPNAKPCTLPSGWTFTHVGSTSLSAYKPSSTPTTVSSVATPSGFSNFPVPQNSTAPQGTGTGTAATQKTTFLSTSVVYATTEITVLKCASTVTDCPAESKTHPTVITSTISQYTTVCPVTATMVNSVPMATAPSTTPAAPAPTSTSAFTYPPQTVTYTVVNGSPTPVGSNSSAPAAATTTAAKINIPNPYFNSVPAEVFPSVPSSVVAQYSQSTGAYAAPSLAPAYTESGSAAIASATAAYAAPPSAASTPAAAPPSAASSTPQAAAPAPAAASTPAAAVGGYGSAPSIVPASNVTSGNSTAPLSSSGGVTGKTISGALAGVAILAMFL